MSGQGEQAAEQGGVRDTLAEHFVMWEEVTEQGWPNGQWRCACDLKFGFSDSAIDHVAEQVEKAVVGRLPGSRTEPIWGVRDDATGNVAAVHSRRAAEHWLSLLSEPSTLMTAQRTRYDDVSTEWTEVDHA